MPSSEVLPLPPPPPIHLRVSFRARRSPCQLKMVATLKRCWLWHWTRMQLSRIKKACAYKHHDVDETTAIAPFSHAARTAILWLAKQILAERGKQHKLDFCFYVTLYVTKNKTRETEIRQRIVYACAYSVLLSESSVSDSSSVVFTGSCTRMGTNTCIFSRPSAWCRVSWTFAAATGWNCDKENVCWEGSHCEIANESEWKCTPILCIDSREKPWQSTYGDCTCRLRWSEWCNISCANVDT